MIQTLIKAKRAKSDEFYTQLSDIENELHHYRNQFEGKTVYCNCDDPRVSNFFRFFSLQFEHYGLKKLIATCYKNQNPDLFSMHDAERAVYLEYSGDQDGIAVKPLQGDGDFRSAECIELLKEADIVVTNPPFSLFRDYLSQLVDYEKKFLIIGNMNAINYKEVFPLIMENRIWLGIGAGGRDMLFDVPDAYARELVKHKKEGSAYRIIDGVVKGRLGNACWYTNLSHKKRNEELILYKKYSPGEFPHYDNYDAIEVSRTKDIPEDWSGAMGVPITFLDKYNPEQFEILGLSAKCGFGLNSHKRYDEYREMRQDGTATGSSGKKTNGNPVMRGMPARNNYYVNPNTGDTVYSLYGRIFIRNRQF